MSADPFSGEFVIRFRALPDPIPAAQRVKAMLKYALRACRLQNVGWGDLDRQGDAPDVRRGDGGAEVARNPSETPKAAR